MVIKLGDTDLILDMQEHQIIFDINEHILSVCELFECTRGKMSVCDIYLSLQFHSSFLMGRPWLEASCFQIQCPPWSAR